LRHSVYIGVDTIRVGKHAYTTNAHTAVFRRKLIMPSFTCEIKLF